jgi:c-di-AMP phosphodiesterase-like protein
MFRNLSGERLETAKRALFQDLTAQAVAIIVVLIIALFKRSWVSTVIMAELFIAVIWVGIRLEQRRTYWQLWQDQRLAQKQKVHNNLNDLEEFANKVEGRE